MPGRAVVTFGIHATALLHAWSPIPSVDPIIREWIEPRELFSFPLLLPLGRPCDADGNSRLLTVSSSCRHVGYSCRYRGSNAYRTFPRRRPHSLPTVSHSQGRWSSACVGPSSILDRTAQPFAVVLERKEKTTTRDAVHGRNDRPPTEKEEKERSVTQGQSLSPVPLCLANQAARRPWSWVR